MNVGGLQRLRKEQNNTESRDISREIPSGYGITQTIDTTNYIVVAIPETILPGLFLTEAKTTWNTFDPITWEMGINRWKNLDIQPRKHLRNTALYHSHQVSWVIADPVYGHVAFVEQVKSEWFYIFRIRF